MRHGTRQRGLRLLSLCGLIAVGSGVGCVMPDHMSQLEKDIADVRQQLYEIQREQEAARQALSQLDAKKDEEEEPITRAEIADLTFRLDQLARETEIADERMNDLGSEVDRLEQQLENNSHSGRAQSFRPSAPFGDPSAPGATTPGQPGSTDGFPPTTTSNPTELYNTAYTDFSKGNYDLAISGFQEFHNTFPENQLADNALYWVGECYYSRGSFSEAISVFDRLLAEYPTSDKVAAANLKKGLSYLEQNQVRQAIVQLQHVHSTFSGSDEAKVARDKLSSLGAPI